MAQTEVNEAWYSHLDPWKGEIGTEVQVQLETVPLGRSYKHEALSYTWGSQQESRTITLNGRPGFPVTRNLYNALRRLRKKSTSRRLWIDAICINQRDSLEKSRQINLMGRIYSQAAIVRIWLGDYEGNMAGIKMLVDLVSKTALELRFSSQLLHAAENTDVLWWDRLWVRSPRKSFHSSCSS